jgi:hypothetical protein
VATLEECERAVHGLAQRLAEVDPELRSRHLLERTVACRIPDLDVVFQGRLAPEGLVDLTLDVDDGDRRSAQVRLTTSSDDLLRLAEGRLAVPAAWATGRLKIEASVLDLLRLRSLL